MTSDGTMYFRVRSRRTGSATDLSLATSWVACIKRQKKLGPEINPESSDSDPYVSSNESLLLFCFGG